MGATAINSTLKPKNSYECMKAKYCLQMYNRIIISNFSWNLIIISQFLSFFLLFFQFFEFWLFLGYFFTPPDPWGTQTFWLWSWIYLRSLWDVSLLQKTASWQLFSMSIVQKPWYGHFHYFGAFWGASRGGISHGGYLEGCTWSQTSVY